MKALLLKEPGVAAVEEIAVQARPEHEVLLQVRMVGMCGSDLNSFRGTNPMVQYPRVLGHEVAATVLDPGDSAYKVGTNVTVSPYTSCGVCAACRRQRPNACVNNQPWAFNATEPPLKSYPFRRVRYTAETSISGRYAWWSP